MFSEIFCSTIKTEIQDSKQSTDVDLGIKLYKIELSKYQELAFGTLNLLSDSECIRADRYHFAKDKNRFIICRTLLKFLLAEHISLDVDKIVVEVDTNKKPYLPTHPFVFFNVTHSEDYAIIAIAENPVGVDIEYVSKEFNYKEILPTTFDVLEIDEISNSREKHSTFYKFWTRKEAIVKALGKGIDDDIIKICVTEGLHSVPRTLVGNFRKISVFSFNITNDYIGAFAITGDLHEFEKIIFYPLPSSDELKSMIH